MSEVDVDPMDSLAPVEDANAIDAQLRALPIRSENLAALTEIRRAVFNLGRVGNSLDRDRREWRREVDLFRGSWLRNLGGTVFNKHHLIDALAMTTEHQRVGFERAKAAGLIGESFYRNDSASYPKPPVARPESDYHEDMGNVLWWKFPVDEPPYCGSPLDSDWPGYHTHFTPLPAVPVPA